MSVEKGEIEQRALAKGLSIVGLDEVGRGCLAGPVCAAAVALDYAKVFALSDKERSLLRDSKTLSQQQRQKMLDIIEDIACETAIAYCSVREIESLGIVGATFSAMRQALSSLKQSYDLLLIDGRSPLPSYEGRQQAIIKGDNLAYSIAAASIIAKEARDQLMRQADSDYPEYGFAAHVGYGTKKHMDALASHGICPLHRRNFAPIQRFEKAVGLYVEASQR